jgi:hypothetical protein
LLEYASVQDALGFLSWAQDKNPSWSGKDQTDYNELRRKRDALKPAYDALLARADAPWIEWVAAVRAVWDALPEEQQRWSRYSLFEAWPANLYAAVRQLHATGKVPSVVGVHHRVPELLARYGDNEAVFVGFALAEGRAPNVAELTAERDAARQDQDSIEAEVKQILARTDPAWLAFVAAVKELMPDAADPNGDWQTSIRTGAARLKRENKLPYIPGFEDAGPDASLAWGHGDGMRIDEPTARSLRDAARSGEDIGGSLPTLVAASDGTMPWCDVVAEAIVWQHVVRQLWSAEGCARRQPGESGRSSPTDRLNCSSSICDVHSCTSPGSI